MKIIDLARELMTWCTFSREEVSKFEESLLTVDNSEELNGLLDGWNEGIYDEDPECLKQELINLI